jgi:hypothetical protein
MNETDAAQQHWLETMAAQQALCGMSDERERRPKNPMGELFQAASRARYGHGDDGPSFLSVPF